MNIILEDSIDYKFKIKDFGIDPVNTRIIVTGDNLVFLNKNKIEKEIKGKLKNCQMIKYIKEKNQLFASSSFFVSTSTIGLSSAELSSFIITFSAFFISS